MKNNMNTKKLKIFNKEICFKNVSFSYGKNNILNDFSLHPHPKELSSYNQFSEDEVMSDDELSSEIGYLT